MKRQKGSITLFSMLSLLLITATIFALLEGTRYQELRRFAKLQTEMALESGFANYNRCLWENYRILGVEESSIYRNLEKSANGRVGKGVNLLRMKPVDLQIEGCSRITDGEGIAFLSCVATYMKENFIYEMAKEVYHQYEDVKKILESSQMDTSNIEKALEESSRNARSISKGIGFLESAKSWLEMGVLDLVIQDTSVVSEAKLTSTNSLLDRKPQKGTLPIEYHHTWVEQVLFQQYVSTYLSSYGEKKEGRALAYEQEYLLGKTSSDRTNLVATVAKILAIREAVNFMYLLSDVSRVAEAESMAMLLIGVTGNPILIEVVKTGLLTAWALGESILDVRALMAGKKISLQKTRENWMLDLENLSEISKDFVMAEGDALGLSYEGYLGILLLFESEQKAAMRVLNLQEATLRKQKNDLVFHMDSFIIRAKANVKYSYKPVFPFLRVIDAEERWEYAVWGNAEYGYD